MANKKRTNALASLVEDMNANTSVRTDVIASERTIGELTQNSIGNTNPTGKPKGKAVSNIPWYPKSKKLKKELKLLALHEDSSVTALIDEGIKMVLEKRGKDIRDYL